MEATEKHCNKCGCTKATTDFYRNKNTRDGFQIYCKTCQSAAGRNYYEKNRERVCEASQRYRQENPEKKRENNRRYREENREARREYARHHYEENRERVCEAAGRWRQKNPELVRVFRQNHRARLRGAEGSHTVEDLRMLHEVQDGCCYYCDAPMGLDVHVDHMTPLSRGGSNWPENLALACATCNLRKNAKTAEEFRSSEGRWNSKNSSLLVVSS